VTRVLVVDDEPQILRALRINLHARQYDVVTAGTGRGAIQAASDAHPDLVILDLGLPDLDGVEVIRSLRKWTQVPIVILSGRMNSAAKVDALDAGADDYVTKPFSVEELLARIRAVTRRTTEPELVEPVQLGRWTVDLRDHVIYETVLASAGASDAQLGPTAQVDSLASQVHLTPTEWQLLQALIRHPGRLVSQRQLLQEVWGPTYVEQTHYLRQYVKALRHKLEDDPTRPRHLVTEPGMGYRFQP
jgi:two-component system, OmpR family, KDP operon response regulator KdpE